MGPSIVKKAVSALKEDRYSTGIFSDIVKFDFSTTGLDKGMTGGREWGGRD